MTRGRIAFLTSLLAILGGGALFISAFTVSMYSNGQTMVAEEGTEVLPGLLMPLVFATIAFAGLSAQCTSGSIWGERAAVIALTLLVLFTIVTGFSIGILVLPITALVAVAVILTPTPRSLDHVFDDVE
jgi:hypothetical protein